MFELRLTIQASKQLEALEGDPALAKRLKAVKKCLRLLAQNPRHTGLNTHEWKSESCPHGKKLFEAYAENNTPGAYRLFFCYVPDEKNALLVVSITPHP